MRSGILRGKYLAVLSHSFTCFWDIKHKGDFDKTFLCDLRVIICIHFKDAINFGDLVKFLGVFHVC